MLKNRRRGKALHPDFVTEDSGNEWSGKNISGWHWITL